jgi:hypothetical protein
MPASMPCRCGSRGLHALVRRGRLPGLARLYPPAAPPETEELWAEVATALGRADLDPWLDLPPQTNEVGRSAVLMAGLLVVAARTRLPLALYELGASAGLNLNLDRYAHRLGMTVAGEADSPLMLAPEWEGPSPPAAPVRVVRRRGVDLNPLDVTSDRDRDRLLAYVWPDQTERLRRAERAIELARAAPPPIDRGDAALWVETRLSPEPEPGVARVLFHSVAFQYFPESTRRRIVERVAAVGGTATADAPFAWLRFEFEGGAHRLTLALWPGGAEEILAEATAHASRVRWR